MISDPDTAGVAEFIERYFLGDYFQEMPYLKVIVLDKKGEEFLQGVSAVGHHADDPPDPGVLKRLVRLAGIFREFTLQSGVIKRGAAAGLIFRQVGGLNTKFAQHLNGGL